MENRLRANDHKGGWQECHPGDLAQRLDEEAEELAGAIVEGALLTDILEEAADVANFAMMIADVCGALATPTLLALRAEAAELRAQVAEHARDEAVASAAAWCDTARVLGQMTVPMDELSLEDRAFYENAMECVESATLAPNAGATTLAIVKAATAWGRADAQKAHDVYTQLSDDEQEIADDNLYCAEVALRAALATPQAGGEGV